jgi:hypothetical protein
MRSAPIASPTHSYKRWGRDLGRRREGVGEHVGVDLDALRDRDRDRALLFEEPLRVDDCHADEPSLAVKAEVVALGGLVEIDGLGGIGAMQIEHVAFTVIADAVKAEVANRDGNGKARRA